MKWLLREHHWPPSNYYNATPGEKEILWAFFLDMLEERRNK